MLKTNHAWQGILRMVSEFSPAGVIGLELAASTILLEIVLGNRPDDFVEVIPGFKLKWAQAHANKEVGVHIIVRETPQVRFTLGGIQHQTDYRLLDINKIHLGPVALNIHLGPVALKRFRFTLGELTPDQVTVHLNLPIGE